MDAGLEVELVEVADVNWDKAVAIDELKASTAVVVSPTVVVGTGVGLGVGAVVLVPSELEREVVVLEVETLREDVVDEDELDPPFVIWVMANAGLVLPESPKRTMM